MLPPPIENAIRAIAADRTSGASRLGRLTLDAMALMIAQANGHPNAADLSEVARRLSEAQPALAKALSEAGVPTKTVPDDAGARLLSDATYVLVGADSVLRDGSVVNKIGTYRLAFTAANDHKPVYAVCETLKFDARYDAVTWPGSSLEKDERQAEASVRAGERFRDFEVTPAQLVTMIATERGAYTPETIRIMLTPRPKD